MRISTLTYALLASAALVACGGEAAKPAQTPADQTPEPASSASTTAPAAEKDEGTTAQVNIDEAIRKACGIESTDAYFDYDSSSVKPKDKDILKKLADCFTTGPLKGKQMLLIGHADPRGETEYNMLLGQRRADNVKKGIVSVGLSEGQGETTSRGEMEANGADEKGWAKDRRVDIKLAQ
jgi:peptidoglycan-associated lipoprotein